VADVQGVVMVSCLTLTKQFISFGHGINETVLAQDENG